MFFLFLTEIHNVRPHTGQKLVASRIRSLLHSEVYRSEIAGMVVNLRDRSHMTSGSFGGRGFQKNLTEGEVGGGSV